MSSRARLARWLSPAAVRPARSAQELRCGCGNLLALLTSGGLEMKCRRCKRLVELEVVAHGPDTVTIRMKAGGCACGELCACVEPGLHDTGTPVVPTVRNS